MRFVCIRSQHLCAAGFVYGWRMALVIIAVLPILIAGAYFQTKFMSGASTLVGDRCLARLLHFKAVWAQRNPEPSANSLLQGVECHSRSQH